MPTGYGMTRGACGCRDQHRNGHAKINTQIRNDIQNRRHNADHKRIFHPNDHKT